MAKSAQRAEYLEGLAGAPPALSDDALSFAAPAGGYGFQVPGWAADLVSAGWIDAGMMEELASQGFDISSPEAWQASQNRANEETVLAQRDQSRNDQFGNDMAWLDPAFQRQAATVTPTTTADALRFGTTADPAAQAAQQSLLNDVRSRGLTADSQTEAAQRNFLTDLQNRGQSADPETEAAQRSLLNRFANRGVTADQNTLIGQNRLLEEVANRGPSATAESRGAQTDLLSEIAARGPSANAESRGAQTGLLDEIAARGTTSDAESEEAQRYALDELFGLYRQGGQGAQDRAFRAQHRAETENWLQGQREADIADRAERGMSGSGGEILDLLADRQAAGSRMSAADLEADAAAERRALEALMAGTSVAGTMRDASDAYQAQNTAERTRLATALRDADDTYQAQNTAERTRLATALRDADDAFANAGVEVRGNVLDQMRTAADRYDTTYSGMEADLASQMRTQADAYQEALDRLTGQTMEGMRNSADTYQVNNDRTSAGLATDMRDASDRFVGANADRMGDAAALNAQMMNDASRQGTDFMQRAYLDTMQRRDAWDRNLLGIQTDVATGTRAHDASQNTQGFNFGGDIATTDVRATNNAQDIYNQGEMDTWLGGSRDVAGADQRARDAFAEMQGGNVNAISKGVETAASAAAGGMTGGSGGFGVPATGATAANMRNFSTARSNIVDPWEDY